MPRDGEITQTLALGGREVPLRLRVNPRARRITLRLDPANGGAVVSFPKYVSRKEALAFAEANVSWIIGRLARLPQRVPFEEGAIIPILGRDHELRHAPEARRGVWAHEEVLWVSGDQAFFARRVTDHLKKEAKRHLAALVMEKAEGLPEGAQRPRKVTVRDTTSRWGSCSADGSLSFSWRLILAPAEVADYVAAHEVAHLKHLNHSKAFWALCERLTEHRAAATAWLKKDGSSLQLYG